MRTTLIILLLAAVAYFAYSRFSGDKATPAPIAAAETAVTLAQGELVGFVDPSTEARGYLGIPFAAAADGANRWRAPQPAPRWEGVREAIAPGPICPQFESLLSGHGDDADMTQATGAEDCLYLNVWAPQQGYQLPVMLWVHGGGNTIGHGSGYNGGTLAVAEDVIVVTINYRLGVFGWFSHPALATGDPADDSGNYGTLDLVRALEWTRDNIATFGGDPNNVTLFGESAGAYDTLAMIASPLAKGLFHRAIVQSGGFQATALSEARALEADGGHPFSSAEITARLLVSKGRAPDLATARAMHEDLPAADIASLLREASIDDFFSEFNGGGFGMVNLPDNFADGYVLPTLSNAEIFGNPDNHNVVPTMLGTNRDENALFMMRDPRYSENFLFFLPRLKDEASYRRAVKYGALAWKERGVDSLAELMTAAGNEDVYAYRWDWDEQPSVLGFDLSVALGAAHGLEIAFVFGDFERSFGSYLYPETPERDALADTMMGYWAEFARTGQPGRGGIDSNPAWTAWGVNDQRQMILDTPPNGPRMDDTLVTRESLIAAIDTDPAATQRERCQYYADSFRAPVFDPVVYASLGEDGCGAYPVDEIRSF